MLIERRGLTTPERVNKVISGEKLGTDIPSRFLRRLQKTAGFGTTAVVGKAVIRQVFIRQMPASIRAHLATTPDSRPTSLESLAVLADWAIASENDAKDNSVGVAEVRGGPFNTGRGVWFFFPIKLFFPFHQENKTFFFSLSKNKQFFSWDVADKLFFSRTCLKIHSTAKRACVGHV